MSEPEPEFEPDLESDFEDGVEGDPRFLFGEERLEEEEEDEDGV